MVGAATSFAETLQLTASLKPDVLLMDLHMRDEHEFPPALVKSQVLQNIDCILAISIWNDEKAKALAESFGAKVLLDKTKLYSELIPAIREYFVNIRKKPVRKPFKKASGPSKQGMVQDSLS